MRQIQVKEFQILPGDFRENTLKLRKLLDECRACEEETEILFEEGVYHFYPDYAEEKLLYISNHDEDTIKKIAFDLTGCRNLTLRGNKTEFRFHTDILPFYIHSCENVTVEGITIDFQRTGYSEAVIRELEPKRMVMEINKEEYPYEILHGRLFFRGENFFCEMTHGCLEMDAERMAPVYMGHDISFNRPYSWSYGAVFKELSEGLVEVTLMGDREFLKTSKVGNHLILRHHARTHPAFYVTYSKNTVLRDIMLYHCTGMAVIAQFDENLTMERFDIRIHPVKKRVFTVTADGFHCIYCKGQILIKDCFLENQLDDPVNIHGIYGRIHKVLSDSEVLVELVEGMQKGVPLGKSGETFGVINNETMLDVSAEVLAEHKMLNRDYQYMRFAKPVKGLQEGFVVENKDYAPDVLVEGCTFQNNRARGLLLTSAGEVIVRDNTFRSAGAAILIEGDSNYWFESGATKSILLEKNRFIDCAYVPDWGEAPIQVSPSAKKYEDGVRYHKYLEIRDNDFYCFDDRLVSAQNIEEICMYGNRIHKTDSFEPIPGEKMKLEGVLRVTDKPHR